MFKKIFARAQELQRRWMRWWGTEPYMPCSEVARKMVVIAEPDHDAPMEVLLIQESIRCILKKNYAVAVEALQLALDELANEPA